IDFGIARFLPPGGRGTQIGSIGYAPPEQYMGKVESRSDLYSLAATMHHLLTGRDPQLEPPFSFPPLCSLAPEVSSRVADVVMTALQQDINKRPASAKAMLRTLPEPPPEKASVKIASGAIVAASPSSTAATASLAKQAAVVRATPIVPSPAKLPMVQRPRSGSASSMTPTIVLS